MYQCTIWSVVLKSCYLYPLYSKLLYELYKSLTKQEQVGSDQMCFLKELAKQACEMSGVPGVTISDRIIQAFKTKLWALKQAMAQAKGGGPIKRLLAKWTTGRYATWSFKIYYHELEAERLQQENNCLRAEKRKLENDLDQLECKKAKIEDKLKEAVAKNQKTNEKFKKKFKAITRKLIRQQRRQRSRGSTASKAFFEYSKRHQSRIRKQMVDDCEASLAFLGLHNFIATKVEVYNENNQQYETINLINEDEIDPSSDTETITNEEIDEINLLLYTKERFNISNDAYHELSMTCKDLPRSWKVQERIKSLNRKWKLSETPGNTIGVQQNIRERLTKRVEHLLKNSSPTDSIVQNKKIQVKLSGDGTNIGKRLHVVNVTFTILDEGSKAMSASGNHLIAIIKEPEDYDKLAESLMDIRKDVESLKQLKIGTECFDIEWFLGGDWKFLACICGLGAATSTYPCIWCKCPLYDKYDGTKSWSLLDSCKGARSVEEIKEKSKPRSCGERYNVKHCPLFPSIPLDHVVIDSLHLFLRISDNLINLLILEFRRQDSIEKKKIFNEGLDMSKLTHMARWESYLNDTLKIPFHWFVCKDSKKLKWRDLTGPEKIRLFRSVDIIKLLPNHPKAKAISELWKKFQEITEMLSSSGPEVNKEQMEEQCNIFLVMFLKLYPTKHVTPYMHALRWHVPEFIEMYGKISPFTQQGLEKLNDKTTKDFFRSTNQQGLDALKQIMMKRNRIEHLEDVGCQREKRTFRCHNCKLEGHNIKTCTSKCNSCQTKPCCSPAHLVKVGGKWIKTCE